MAISITNLSGGNTPADGSDPRTFPAIWNATATDLEGVATDLDTLEATVGAHDLNSLSGVGITTPVEGDLLTYNGTSWVNGVPAGRILQVVSTTKTDTFTTTSTSFTDVTGVSATITPSSASNKIIVTCNFAAGGGSDASALFLITRGGTPVNIGDASSSRTRAASSIWGKEDQGETGWISALSTTTHFLDSPATTSAITYQLQARVGAGGTAVIGRSTRDLDTADYARTPSNITLMEVAG